MFFVGIDIAKNAHEATVIDEQGNTLVKPFKFKNSAAGFEKLSSSLHGLSAAVSDFDFGMEATGHYWLNLYTRLIECGYNVHVINPVQSDALRGLYIRQTKNDANWIFYRVSDMMLIRAEALVCMMTDEENDRNDSLGQVAFELVKAIEDRSCPNGESGISYSNYSTKDLMLDLVYDARRREFLFEGKRWFDLVRRSRLEGNTTYLVDAVSDKFTENAATATGKLGNMMAIYWPYNYDELQVNPNLTQNPAYPEAGDSYESTN